MKVLQFKVWTSLILLRYDKTDCLKRHSGDREAAAQANPDHGAQANPDHGAQA